MPTLTNLPIVTTATGSMIFPVVDGSTTKQLSINNLKTFVEGAAPVTSVNNKVGAVVLTATNITGFATVAISGSYNDLSNRPSAFVLTTATGSVLGGVKIGSNINVTSDGTISVDLFNGGTINSPLNIFNETEVTIDGENGTGALLVAGGVGIGGNLIVINTVTAASFVSTTVGVPEVYSASNLNLTAVGRVQVTQSPFKVWNVSTSTRDTIAASNGDIIYNTGNNKFQGYANGVWVDLN
jgi:hypothetical protein